MRRPLVFFLLAISVVELFASGSVPIRRLKAEAFPAHVEINWKNPEHFEYQIFSSLNGSAFRLEKKTRSNRELIFFDPVKHQTPVTIRLIPAGMDVNSVKATGYEVKTQLSPPDDEALLDMIQKYTTRYFDEFSEPATGMARERNNHEVADMITTGGTGFGIMALVAGTERSYLSRERFLQIMGKIVSFLEKAERFHGAWAHWYDADTKEVFSFSKYDNGGDLVETAFLVQGLLTAREYFHANVPEENDLKMRIDHLWKGVEWNWYTQGTDSLYWHWSKNYEFKMNHRIKGFDETMITYVLAASSPTYPITKKVYDSSYKLSSYYKNGNSYFGIKLDLGMSYGGPLFFTHYSFLGMDPRGLTDENTNYFERNKAHALIHWQYARENPKKHAGYGANCWGFTSSDDPLLGYASHHPFTKDENGTVSPTAAVSSLVYVPEQSMLAMRHYYYDLGRILFGPMGFYDAYNPGLVEGQQVVRSYLAIDQGPEAAMIENFRSGLLWKLFGQIPEVEKGLKTLDLIYR